MQIIVLGPHRSGTSLVTRLINMMGAYFDAGNASIGFNDENPKGFWERSDVIKCNEEILKYYNCSWDRLEEWKFQPVIKKTPKELENTTGWMKNIVLEMDAHRPWVVKDPRMCITFPYWKPLLEVPVAVVVYRDPVEVAVSLRHRNQFSLAQGLALWEYYAVGIVNAIKGVPTVYISHSEMLADPVKVVQKMHDKLKEHGVREIAMPADKEITAFIEPALHRSKANDMPHAETLTSFQQELIAYIKGEKIAERTLQPSLFAVDTMKNADSAGKLRTVLEETNQKMAAIDQQRNELKSELEVIRPNYEDKIIHLYQERERLLHQIGTTHQSVSWKVGNGLVKFAKRLTFQG